MRTIPLFPLPGVVLFPGTLLPLHVFEPRYRALVAHALETDRLIGMAMISAADPEIEPGRPAIHELGGAGKIVESELLEDGRYNIILEGSFRFRIVREETPGPYRSAMVEVAPTEPFPSGVEEQTIVTGVRELFAGLQPQLDLPPLPAENLSAERLSGELALRLRWPPDTLQKILEAGSLPERFGAIASRLSEWKEMADFLKPYRSEVVDPLTN
ncbi:MAG: LON peptidase substrate-binding domain-containing protein [Thermoanaerobaculia bacterium]